MKIILEPETEEEKKQRKIVSITGVFEFALVGRSSDQIKEMSILHIHICDKATLLGRIEELKQRVLSYEGKAD